MKTLRPSRPRSWLLFVALPCLAILLAPLTASARDREVSASGHCTRQAAPDRGRVVMTAEAQSPDLQAASKRASELYERAIGAVKRLGLADLEIKTVEYSLNEVREWERNRTVSKGFKARLGFQVSTSSLEKLGDVIAIAARAELRDVGGLSTYLSTAKLRQEQFACLQDASEDARAKARKLAEAMGAQLGDAVSLSESHSGGDVPAPGPLSARMDGDSRSMKTLAMPAPAIEAGSQDVSVTVQAVFALK